MQTKHFFLLNYLIVSSLVCVLTTVSYGQSASLAQADSLFRYRKYTEAFVLYEKIWQQDQVYTASMLLKMAFIKEGLEEYPEALYFLNQFYRHNPDARVLQKINELADKYKLQGYKTNDFEYLIALYTRHQVWVNLLFLTLFLFGLVNLFWRKKQGKDILYRAILFNVLLLGYAWVLNYGLEYRKGIIRNDKVFVMNAPSAGAKLIATADRGNCYEIVSKKDIWYKVRFQQRDEWIEAYIRQNNFYVVE